MLTYINARKRVKEIPRVINLMAFTTSYHLCTDCRAIQVTSKFFSVSELARFIVTEPSYCHFFIYALGSRVFHPESFSPTEKVVKLELNNSGFFIFKQVEAVLVGCLHAGCWVCRVKLLSPPGGTPSLHGGPTPSLFIIFLCM